MIITFLSTAIAAMVIYLLLNAGSGTIALWSQDELMLSAAIGLIVGFVSAFVLRYRVDRRLLNPKRWIFALLFIFPFLRDLIKANIDVAVRVITGRINPGIVRISTGYKTSLATTWLANSITLTPGTLSVDVDEKTNDIYVHWIDMKTEKATPADVAGSFPEWARRIAE